MTKWKIYNEDAVEWAKNYQKAKFHALLCDAPYELNFMGQKWDRSGVAFRPETWEAFGEVLHPGAFGMAFSASRNWHRMAVAIEDAGFILHPTIFLWSYGQGFPKATNISKQLHKQGNEDGAWEGHRYGLQALKPAVEPIIVFQKPYEGRPLDNIVETGAGALNIEGGRIPTQDDYVINQFEDGMKPFGNGAGHKYKTLRRNAKGYDGLIGSNTFKIRERRADDFPEPSGRWPANLILDGSAERLDAQSGEIKGSSAGIHIVKNAAPAWKQASKDRNVNGFGDAGGASRFFYNVSQQLDESDPVYYCAKVSPAERNVGLDDLDDVNYAVSDGARKNIERGNDEYLQDSIGINRVKKVKNPHPTLKPIDLCRYLATLLLPPEEYAPRRIFIPFSGVASEMIGAGLAGWEHVVGVEFDTENGYVDIAEKRLQHWLKEQK